ncbi:MAG: sialate O-acetylesterase, partial [Mucilaginibacter sp.]|nr:sialate O-acetylesterase [Mucilaginibacter sp.]
MNSIFKKPFGVINLFLFFLSFSAYADIKLPQLVSNSMVLQRDTKLKIWGWASPGERVTIAFNEKKSNTVTSPDGKWLIILPAMKAGGPFTMTIKGNNQIILSDILIGDVWFCSGQSNMVIPMERVKEKYPDEIANANYPQIRNFFVPTLADVTKVHDDLPPGKWTVASPTGVLGFGAASYFFAKDIYLKYHIPIGIINSSVGGTPIEAWISAEGYKGMPKYEEMIKNFRDTAYMNNLTRRMPAGRNAATTAQRIAPDPDKGLSGPKPWYDPTFIPEGWHKFWMPGYWADQGVKDLNGTVWFRKE